MASPQLHSKLSEMIQMLDQAVDDSECKSRCEKVKNVLEDIVKSGEDFVPLEMLAPHPTSYARRLIHRDPEGRYSILAMVWGVGQGTKLHDHAGRWCVECVYRGRIRVVSYDLIEENGDTLRFQEEMEIFAGIGDAGALIPPYEYHTIENAENSPSVTIHVYGGELDWCHIFEPLGENSFKRVRKELSYTS